MTWRVVPWVVSGLLVLALIYDHRGAIWGRLGLGLGASDLQSDRTEFSERMKLGHQRMDPSVPPGRVLILGDSITHSFFPNNQRLKGMVNYGVGSDTTLNLLDRLGVYAGLASARSVVVQVGSNDLSKRSAATTVENIKRVVEALPKNVPILLNGLFPVNESRLRSDPTLSRRTNKDIWAINAQLERFCAESKYQFVDTRSMAGPDGQLKAEFDEGDGLHLNRKGYLAWEVLLVQALDAATQGSRKD